MSITGLPDGPPIRPGLPIADLASGMFAASGILAALFNLERTGRGQAVDVALLDSVAALLTYQAAGYFATGVAPQRLGNRHATIAPYDLFNASDGEFILAVGNDAQFQRCCEAIGLDALARDARFATNRDRVARYDDLRDVLAAQFRTAPRATWLERLRAAGVPAGPVHDVREFFADRYVRDRGLVTTMDHAAAGPLDMVRSPISMSGTPTSVKTPPPLLGQHTAAVLKEILCLDDEEVRQLEAQRVIACARHL